MITTASRVTVRLLGHPEVRREGSAVALPSRNTLLLLARLAIEGTQSREALAALFWPDADEARGRTNLRRTIAYLREACGRDIDVLETTSSAVTLTGAVIVDVRTADAAIRSQPPDAAVLQQAVALWDGDFLEGIEPENEELESWVRQQRQSWQVRLSRAAEQLVAMLAGSGRSADAWAVTDRWQARDPLSEAAQRERMRLQLMRGDRAAALDGYDKYAQQLERDLGVTPARELQDLAALARSDSGELAALRAATRPEAPMIGRDAAHASLARAFGSAERGDATLALVTGEAGIGKTRLLDEFLEWARPRAAAVRSTRAFPSAHRIAYGGLAAAFADELPRPGSRRAVSLPAIAESVARVIAREGRTGVFVLAVDDVHWLDPDSLELLVGAAAAVRSERARLLLVATLRDEALAASSQLTDWLARMVRELRYDEIALAPLTESDTMELVRSWPDPLDGSAQGAAIAAAGRPLLIVETLRYLAAGGDTTTIAPAARESMRARLRGLSAPAASLAAAASVLETEASLTLLAGTAAISAPAAERGLGELLRGHVLVGDGQYAFCHELLRRTEYALLPAEERAELHARAARALDAAHGPASEVARHAELSGQAGLAWDRRVQAAREASGVAAHRVAADQLRAAIALRPDDAATWLDLGRAEELAGRSDLAADTYRRLVERTRKSGQVDAEAAALVRLAELAGRNVTAGAPVDLLAEAAEAARDAADVALQVDAALTSAQVDAYRGDLARADATLDGVVRIAATAGRPELIARSHNLRAFIRMGQGRWAEVPDLSRRAQRIYRSLGDPVMELDSRESEIAALVFLGDWRGAARRAERALARAEGLRNPWAVSNASLNWSWALRDGGELDEALAVAERGRLAAIEAGFLPLQVLNAQIGGRCRRELGDVDGAVRAHESLVELARDMDGVAYLVLAEELCADHAVRGDWTAAAHWAREAVSQFGEASMFAHLSIWHVAAAQLRAGEPATVPDLPDTPRYDVVRLRCDAVIAQHDGRTRDAARLRREALDLAERLMLRIDADELRAESTA